MVLNENETEKDSVSSVLRVLVVDDDSKVRELMHEFLRREGHSVDCAVNGREGLEKFKAEKYDLVISDGAMPEMNGYQFVQSVKKSAPDIPVIMLSGFGDLLDFQNGKPEGVDFVLRKPVALADLRRTVAKAIGGR